MAKGLFALHVGEFGWELMNWQAHVRYVARQHGYERVVVCTRPASFDLYRDFAHEFLPHGYAGEPMCQHLRISKDLPRIDAHWFRKNGVKEYEPYKQAGYDLMLPPDSKPDVRHTIKEQLFIQYGSRQDRLTHDIVFHARNRKHMNSNNWPQSRCDALVERLKADGLSVACAGLPGSSLLARGATDYLGASLSETMDIMASATIVIGPSSGPMCLSMLCRTPVLTWFGGHKYVGAGLKERFERLWNPLNNKVWALDIGWRPSVDGVYDAVHAALAELGMSPMTMQPPVQADAVRKETVVPTRRVREVVKKSMPDTRRQERMRQRAERVRKYKEKKAAEAGGEIVRPSLSISQKPMAARVERETPKTRDATVVDKAGLNGRCLKIYVPAGIGDFSWIYSKLCRLQRPLSVQFSTGGPPRSCPMTEILPWVRHASYGSMPWLRLKSKALPADTLSTELDGYGDQVAYLEANTHLESGKRIELWMPDLQVNHHYHLDIPYVRVKEAIDVLPSRDYVAIFTSGVSQVKNWKAWNEHDWVNFMDMFRRQIADIDFVLIGAGWDVEMAARVEGLAKRRRIRFTNLANKLHLGSSLSVLKMAKYFVGFPSGLTILADVLYVRTTMFYPKSLQHMPGTYADPERIVTGDFHELQFCPPADLVRWMTDEYRMKDKL